MEPTYRMRDNFSMADKHANGAQPTYYFREWRKQRGLNQEMLAEMVGLTASSISQLENGKQGFTDSTLVAIAKALDCRPGDLLLWAPDKIEASKAPIRGEQQILATLQRIDGLSEKDVAFLYDVILKDISFNTASRQHSQADDRSESATARHVSSPSR